MLVNDGVFPSNEDRGYVLRRILRRAVRHAFLLGAEKLVLPGLVEESIAIMGDAYPDVVKNRDFITGVITREEERFRQTLRTGLVILEDELSAGATVLPGATAFKLHDTFGFPLEVTTEIAAERGRHRRRRGLQRRDGRAAPPGQGRPEGDRRRRRSDRPLPRAGRAVRHRPSSSATARTRATCGSSPSSPSWTATDGAAESWRSSLDRTPFYAESGGQVGDTGTITHRHRPRPR